MKYSNINIIYVLFLCVISSGRVNAENYFNSQVGSMAPLTTSGEIVINEPFMNSDWESRVLEKEKLNKLGINYDKKITKKDAEILKNNYDTSVLSYDIYDRQGKDKERDKKVPGTDYKLIKYENDDFSGFNAGIYENSKGHLIVAFGGTTAQERGGKKQLAQDAFADLSLLNKEGDENKQFSKLRDFLNTAELSDKNYLITGHSLGGGLAQYASFYTGNPAVTYNTAPMTINEKALSNLSKNSFEQLKNNQSPNIINIRTLDDPLTLIQKIQENIEAFRTPNPVLYSSEYVDERGLELKKLVNKLLNSKDFQGGTSKLVLLGLITKKQIEIFKDFKNWDVKRDVTVESIASLLGYIQVKLYNIPINTQIGKLMHGETINLDMESGHSMLDIAMAAYEANYPLNKSNSSSKANVADISENGNNSSYTKVNNELNSVSKSNIGSFSSTVNIKGAVTQTATGSNVKQDLNVGSAQKSQANSFNAVVTTGSITQTGKNGAQQFINVGGMNNSKVDRFDAQVTTGNIEQIANRGERQEMDIGSVTNSTVTGTATTRVSTGAVKQTGDGEISLGAIKNSNVKQFNSNLNVKGKLEGNNIRMGSVIGQEKYDNDGNYAGQAK